MIRQIGPEEYDELCRRLGTILQEATPEDSTVAVVSKGDPRLIEIDGRTGRHFPQEPDGKYAGFHPRTSEDAITAVETVAATGDAYLCFPTTALWWLDHYDGLTAWLDGNATLRVNDPTTCLLYELSVPSPRVDSVGSAALVDEQVRGLLDALLPEGAPLLVVGGSLEGTSNWGRTVASVGTVRGLERRRLGAGGSDGSVFILALAEASDEDSDPAIVEFLDLHARRIAHRERLCDLFELEAR